MNTYNQFEQINPSLLSQYFILSGLIILACAIIASIRRLFLRPDAIYKNEKSKLLMTILVIFIALVLVVLGVFIYRDEVFRILFGSLYFAASVGFVFVLLWGFFQMRGASENALQIIENLVCVIEAEDENLDGHSLLVQNLTMLMYDYLPLLDRISINPNNLQYASLLIDIGKLGISHKLISKKGKLSPEELEMIHKYPELCVEIFEKISSLKTVMKWVKYHHERIDGEGYYHLKGKEIPLPARILALADTYSAITMARSYRASLPYENAIAELRLVAGTQLDKDLVEIFCSIPRVKVTACMEDVKAKMKQYSLGEKK